MWTGLSHRRIRMTYELHEFRVQVELLCRNQIDDANCHPALQQSGTFGDECVPMLRPIFVGGTYNLNCGDQAAVVSIFEDAHFVLVKLGQVGFYMDCWLGDPSGGCHATLIAVNPTVCNGILQLRRGNIDFEGAKTNRWSRYIPRRQDLA